MMIISIIAIRILLSVNIVDFLVMHAEIYNLYAHVQLQNFLIEHIWRLTWEDARWNWTSFYLNGVKYFNSIFFLLYAIIFMCWNFTRLLKIIVELTFFNKTILDRLNRYGARHGRPPNVACAGVPNPADLASLADLSNAAGYALTINTTSRQW
jgi:hypothetical protein